MANTNCLEGIRCPECGQEDSFFIEVLMSVKVTDEGVDQYGDAEWNDESSCSCHDCGHEARLINFRTDAPAGANKSEINEDTKGQDQ